MTKQPRDKNAKLDAPGASFNPIERRYWTEGEQGRKSGSKVPPEVRKAKRRSHSKKSGKKPR